MGVVSGVVSFPRFGVVRMLSSDPFPGLIRAVYSLKKGQRTKCPFSSQVNSVCKYLF